MRIRFSYSILIYYLNNIIKGLNMENIIYKFNLISVFVSEIIYDYLEDMLNDEDIDKVSIQLLDINDLVKEIRYTINKSIISNLHNNNIHIENNYIIFLVDTISKIIMEYILIEHNHNNNVISIDEPENITDIIYHDIKRTIPYFSNIINDIIPYINIILSNLKTVILLILETLPIVKLNSKIVSLLDGNVPYPLGWVGDNIITLKITYKG